MGVKICKCTIITVTVHICTVIVALTFIILLFFFLSLVSASLSLSLLLLAPTLVVLVTGLIDSGLIILVTSTTGFVETHVSMVLKQWGDEVLGLDNFSGSWMGLFTMEEVMNELVGKFVTVIHGGLCGGGGGRIWEIFV